MVLFSWSPGLEHRDRAGEGGQRFDLAHAGVGDDPAFVLGDQHHAVGAGRQLVGLLRRGARPRPDRGRPRRSAVWWLGVQRSTISSGTEPCMRAPDSTSTGPVAVSITSVWAGPKRMPSASSTGFDVGDDLVLLLAVARQQLLVVVDEVGADAQLVVAPDLGDVVDAVPADRVDEELGALQQLLDQQLLVGAVQRVGPAEDRGEGGLDRGAVLADADPVGAGAVERFDHDRTARRAAAAQATASAASAVFSSSAARRPARAQRLATSRSCRAAPALSALPLEGSPSRSLSASASGTPGSAPTTTKAGSWAASRAAVASRSPSWTTFSTKSLGAKGAQVEVGQAAGCSARGRPAGRRRRSAAPVCAPVE